jgi:hypothetical protein
MAADEPHDEHDVLSLPAIPRRNALLRFLLVARPR